MSEYNPSKNNLLLDSSWYKGTVIKGARTGRTIGFPTANIKLTVNSLQFEVEKGVYSCDILLRGVRYKGMLYFGPRLVKNETHDVVEIHILDFDEEIYNQEIKFKLEKYIRDTMDFKNLNELKEQLTRDLKEVRMLI